MSGADGSVLYDALGPRGRRRALVGTVAAVSGLLVVAAVVLRRLGAAGQLAWERWAPLLDPGDDTFVTLWTFLGGGLLHTLEAAVLAVAISLVLGTLLASLRLTASSRYRWAVVGWIELMRGVPVILAIFFAYRVLPELGVDLPVLWYVVIGLVIYNSVVIAEIVRAGVASLPKGQAEAAAALGLTRIQALRLILLPQSFRIMLPALISQLVVAVKDTSLGIIVSFPELLRRANVAIQSTHNPIQILFVVALIYIALNYGLGRLAELTQRRLGRARQPRARSGARHGSLVATP